MTSIKRSKMLCFSWWLLPGLWYPGRRNVSHVGPGYDMEIRQSYMILIVRTWRRISNDKACETNQAYQSRNRMEPIVLYNMPICISNLSSNIIKCYPFMCPKHDFHLLGHTNWSARQHLHSILHWSFQILAIEWFQLLPQVHVTRYHHSNLQNHPISKMPRCWRSVKHQGPELMDYCEKNNRDVKWYQVYPTNRYK